MPVASSMGELEQMLRHQLQSAIQVVQAKAEADMYEETGKYYTAGAPVLYPRTGALGASPRTSGLTAGGNSVSFEAYLEEPSYAGVNAYLQSLGFSSKFDGYTALNAAETHTYRTKGRSGFWARSEQKIEQDLNSTLASFFS